MKKILTWAVIILFIIGIFLLGRCTGSGSTVNEKAVNNVLLIREIAELASLEVQGNASFKQSNVDNSGEWSDNLKRVFAENTAWVSVPYTAKYGVDTDSTNFSLTVSGKTVTIRLPPPKLLSFELRMNQMETSSRKGWFTFSNDETYTEVQKKLYDTNRSQLEENVMYQKQSMNKIIAILRNYYTPLGYELKVNFTNSLTDLDTPGLK
ncbi:DUF4230 domain-containing protein [Chitinophaga rhizosphaerae]|uniref:DUF4230 domain-containing protein n=1 Tax=Chitinophaga rhizosphaerae TaxID=1864947 RepID=UPI000F7FAED0|nr:DUF4230 domain-containing protein [Chitinophaga rhizosphaerae]